MADCVTTSERDRGFHDSILVRRLHAAALLPAAEPEAAVERVAAAAGELPHHR